MLVGLGSGSTAELAIAELGRRVAFGLRFQGVPSSNRTRDLATGLGIPLVDLDYRVTRQPIVVDWWESAENDTPRRTEPFSTVASWNQAGDNDEE